MHRKIDRLHPITNKLFAYKTLGSANIQAKKYIITAAIESRSSVKVLSIIAHT